MAKALPSVSVGQRVGVVLSIAGLHPTLNAVRRLPLSMQGKIVRPALRAGAKVILEETKRNVPVYRRGRRRPLKTARMPLPTRKRVRRSPLPVPGLLKRSLRVRAMQRKKGQIGYLTQTSKSANVFTGRAFYGAFLEFGTRRGTRKQFPGIRRNRALHFARAQRITPRRFMKKSFDRAKHPAYARVLAEMRSRFPAVVAEAKAKKASQVSEGGE